jgi:hypothetical protein
MDINIMSCTLRYLPFEKLVIAQGKHARRSRNDLDSFVFSAQAEMTSTASGF